MNGNMKNIADFSSFMFSSAQASSVFVSLVSYFPCYAALANAL